MGDDVMYRARAYRTTAQATKNIAQAIATGIGTYEGYKNIKNIANVLSGNETIAEYGARKIEEDTDGMIKIQKKNIATKYKMPSARKSGAKLQGANRFTVQTARRVNGKLCWDKRGRPRKVNKLPTATGNLKKQVVSIQKQLKADQAYHTHKRRETNIVSVGVNQSTHTTLAVTRTTELEAAMATLRYYNPSSPGTLTTADASTGTYSRKVHFQGFHKKLTIRNNYQIPVKVRVYSCVPKNDTSILPTTFYSDGITDQCISGSTTSPQLYLFDIDMVKDNWKSVKTTSKILNPGQQMVCTYNAKAFDYDPSSVDSHALVYQKKYQAQAWVVRLEGIISHDTVESEQTTNQGAIDYINDTIYKMTYDAGTNLNDISFNNVADASFTTSGVCTNRPVADNQTYSVS